jgi:hypothetical protein
MKESIMQIPVSRNILCGLYAILALLALIGTWRHNLAYLNPDISFVETNLAFWKDTLTTAASRSISADLFMLSAAVGVWMVLEARRLHLRGVWLYLLLIGLFVAIAVAVPLFLLQRERALARENAIAGTLDGKDALLLALWLSGIVAFVFGTL